MKKLISMAAGICLMLSMALCSASAAPAEPFALAQGAGYSLMYYRYTKAVRTTVSRGTNGVKYSCKVIALDSATEIKVYLYLQKKQDGGWWKDIDVTYKTTKSTELTVTNTYEVKPTGSTKYRAMAHVYVNSGEPYDYIEMPSSFDITY